MAGKKKVHRKKNKKASRRPQKRRGASKRKTPAVVKYGKQLKLLVQCPAKTRKAYISEGGPGLIKAVCECALNILKGRVPLSSTQKARLKRHKKDLRTLTRKKTSLKTKKRILQKGGFLHPLLAPLLAPIIGSAVGGIANAVSKKIFR